MNRRAFITLIGGAAAAWPLAARAQQPERIRRIGVLMGLAETDPFTAKYVRELRLAVQNLGWTEGKSIQFAYRYASGDPELARVFARALPIRRSRTAPISSRARQQVAGDATGPSTSS